jgi:hypothetical protein
LSVLLCAFFVRRFTRQIDVVVRRLGIKMILLGMAAGAAMRAPVSTTARGYWQPVRKP